uniref:Uncoordinated protein 58 n=1 Tax=Syphacia muris TaxID=451379 RepID=A0A158R4B5_9BILA
MVLYTIDHVTRWDGVPLTSQSALLEAEDGGTIASDGINVGEEAQEAKSCTQKAVKVSDLLYRNPMKCLFQYIKILIPHVILVAVLIGYLCLGAWILMILETNTELTKRSKKLVNLTNLMTLQSEKSWLLIESVIQRVRETSTTELTFKQWNETFWEYMLSVATAVDEYSKGAGKSIRAEMIRPNDLSNMHNKWTFPTALLYVLTVLTTCGYGEVSVDTDFGKVFSVCFALVGIPLMFITAADIGKFLSDTLLRFVSNWRRMVRKLKSLIRREALNEMPSLVLRHFWCQRSARRKSIASTVVQSDPIDLLAIDPTDEKLWFPIGAYVFCICLYCSMGSAMFINWERTWSFIHAFHFGFNLIVTVGLGDIVVKDYIFLSLIVAFVIVGLSVVTMCVDLASTHLKAYFTRIHYFGRAKRFLGMSEELKEIVALLSAMRRKKGGKVTWNDVREFLDNELRDRPFEPHELLMKLRFIDETSSGMSTIRRNSFQSDFFRESDYYKHLSVYHSEEPAFL